jgi:hybrid polyketide synthase/nonribosomal peptide synthetase FtdB
VQFSAAVDRALEDGYELFLEIGAPTLARYVLENASQKNKRIKVFSCVRKNQEISQISTCLSSLYSFGVDINWNVYYKSGNFVELPLYKWHKRHFWAESEIAKRDRFGETDVTSTSEKKKLSGAIVEINLQKEPWLKGNEIFCYRYSYS